MSTTGFTIDPDALTTAARAVRTAVTDGTTETQCVAWGAGYGHEGLAAAVVTFAGDVDLAVDRLADEGEAMASELVEQAEAYRSVDSGVQGALTGLPTPAPSPFVGSLPLSPSLLTPTVVPGAGAAPTGGR